MELVFKVYQEVVKLKVNTARILFLGWLVLSLASRVFALDTIEPTWLRFWGGGENDRGYGVAIDARGNVYVTGGTCSFGAGKDLFLVKYTPEGEMLWEKTSGKRENDWAGGVTIDSQGNLYVIGGTNPFVPMKVTSFGMMMSFW